MTADAGSLKSANFSFACKRRGQGYDKFPNPGSFHCRTRLSAELRSMQKGEQGMLQATLQLKPTLRYFGKNTNGLETLS